MLIAIYALYLLPIFVPSAIRRGPLARSALPAATIVLMLGIAARGVLDLWRARIGEEVVADCGEGDPQLALSDGGGS